MLLVLPLPLLLLACSPRSGDTPVQVDTGGAPEACDRYNTLGVFTVEYHEEYAGFSGMFVDGPSPWTLDELIDGGDCKLYGWQQVPACEPPCEGTDVCGFGDECHPWPGNLPVGTVELAGTSPELSLEPTEWGSYYYSEPWPAPYAAGDSLTLSASGSDEVEPFSMSLQAAAPLDADLPAVTMRPGEPLRVSWEPAGGASSTRMLASLSIDHHASTPGYALCEVPDAWGSFTVSADIVDGLFEAGSTGIGTYVESAHLTRATQAWAETERGCALFQTVTYEWFTVDEEL